MKVPMKQPVTEETGKVIVDDNTNQFYRNYVLANISLALSAFGTCPVILASCCLPTVHTGKVPVHTCGAAHTGTPSTGRLLPNTLSYL